MTRPANWHTSPLYNPLWAGDAILAQCTIPRHGKKLVCLAFCEEDIRAMTDTLVNVYEGDYRVTFADGPARTYQQRTAGSMAEQYTDGLWKPRSEREKE